MRGFPAWCPIRTETPAPIGGDSGSGTQDIILGPSSSVIGTTFFADPRLRVTVAAWLTRLLDAGTHSRSLAPEGPTTRGQNTHSAVERDRRIISSPWASQIS